MATVPTLTVKVAFVSNPLDTAPTWVDISSDVRDNSIEIERVRPDPWSPQTVGRLQLQINNRTRKYDSTYTSSPYNGNLRPRKQIWVYATWLGVDYDIFRGFCGPWRQKFVNDGKDAVIDMEAFDALEWCGRARMSTDPFADYLTAIGTPKLWLRQADSSRWIDRQATYQPDATGTITADAAPFDSLKANAIAFGGSTYFTSNVAYTRSTGAWSVGFWIKTTATTGPIFRQYDNVIGVRNVYCELVGGAPHFVSTLTPIGPTQSTDVQSSIEVNDDRWHFVMFTSAGSSSILCYVDGVLDSATTVATGAGGGLFALAVQRIGGDGSTYIASGSSTTSTAPSTVLNNAALADLFTVEAQLSATQVSTLYGLGIGYLEESSATRLGRYLDDVGWPSAWRSISTKSRATCGDLTYNGRQLITALQELERTEQGRIFAAKDGKITLHGRYYTDEETRGSTSQATFSDDGADFGYRAPFLKVEDDLYVRNDVTVANPAGDNRSTDSTSITTYGPCSETVDTIVSSITQRIDMARGLVVRWKDQAFRIEPFTVKQPTALWQTLLGLELGDRVTVEQTPMRIGSQVATASIVDSIKWRISNRVWTLQLAVSPVPPKTFILDVSLLDSTDVLAF